MMNTNTPVRAEIVGDGQRYAVLPDGQAFPVQEKTRCGQVRERDKVLILIPENPQAIIGGGNHYAEVVKIFVN